MPFAGRRLVAGTLILLFAASLLACRSPGTSQGRTLLIYTPHGQDMMRDFAAR